MMSKKNNIASLLVSEIKKYERKMRKCPFCGCSVGINICDEEGNLKDINYLDDSYSGIGFVFNHNNGDCVLCDFNSVSPIYSVDNVDYDKCLSDLVRDWNGGFK